MKYHGIARNLHDVEDAVALAARTFRSQKTSQKESLETKKSLLSPYGPLSERDVIVLIDDNNKLCGTCFLVDRDFYRGEKNIKGTFLTSICIDEASRGKNYSKILMDCAIAECEKRESLFAVLIARRAVDYFYNKHYFWGLSQYTKIKLNLADIEYPLDEKTLTHISKDELCNLNNIYQHTYNKQYGSCIRSEQYWNYVLWKVDILGMEFESLKNNGEIIGYVIYSSDDVYELAAKDTATCLQLLGGIRDKHSLGDIALHVSQQHPIVNALQNIDFSIIKRQCCFGGHMVRVINPDILLGYIKGELEDVCKYLGITNHVERYDDIEILIRDGNLEIAFSGSPHSYKNTCFFMGSDYLSAPSSMLVALNTRSFNVPLLDQI